MLAGRREAAGDKAALRARGGGAFAALFAAALDDRIAALELDLGGRCLERQSAPLVPFTLRHGDVFQWAAVLADRRLALAGLAPEVGEPAWLKDVFRTVGTPAGLH